MTIRKVLDFINYIKVEIIDNGIKEQLQDNWTTIQNGRQNLVLMKELTDKTSSILETLKESEINNKLKTVLVSSPSIIPFTSKNYDQQFERVRSQEIADVSVYFAEVTPIFTNLISDLTQNLLEVDKIEEIFRPFLEKDYSELQTDTNSLVSLVFADEKTTSSLKNITKELQKWNTGLHIYHQLISEESPKDFELVDVDNGSIDFVIHLDFSVAEKLLELIKAGIEVFAAYLLYKTTVAQITLTYRGNEKLLAGEVEREKLLIENVSVAISDEIKRQLKDLKKINKKQIEAQEKKIEEVTNLVKDHVIKGNTIRLLSAPPDKEEMIEEETKVEKRYIENKKQFRQLDENEKQKLLKAFKVEEEDNENSEE